MKRSAIAFTQTAARILRRLHPDIRRSIREALDELSENPYIGKPLKKELEGLWSLPVSHHRVIYQIDDGAMTIVFVGARRDVYERLRELLLT